MKEFKRKIASFLAVVTLLQAFPMKAFAYTNDNGKMWYTTDNGSYNIKGYYNGSLYKTTFADGGYHTFIEVDGQEKQLNGFGSNSTIRYNGIDVSLNLSYVSGGRYVKAEYVVKNTTSSTKTISLATGADIQIGGNDRAPINLLPGNKGLRMSDGSAQFVFIGKDSYGIETNVDTIWFGYYGNWRNNKFNSSYSYQGDSTDSGMAYSWKNRRIGAGETKKYSVLIGIGEYNDPPVINLQTNFKSKYYANEEVLISGTVNDINYGDSVTVKYAVDNGTEYSIPQTFYPNGTAKPFSGSFRIPANTSAGTHNLKVWAVDDKGNMSTPKEGNFIVAIDKTPPQATYTISPSSWTNKSVQIKVNATDSESGVSKIKMPNGSIVTGSTATHTVTNNGTYTFYIEDKVANSRKLDVKVTNIDKIAPSIITSLSTSSWTNSDLYIDVKATDIGIGVKRIKLPNGDFVNSDSAKYKISENGDYTFYAEDSLGNTSSKTVKVRNIDKINPTATHNINLVGKDKYAVTILADDDLSGVKRIKLPNNKYVEGNKATYEVVNNETYYFEIEDNAGNIIEYSVIAKMPLLSVYKKGNHVQTEWINEVENGGNTQYREETYLTKPGEDINTLPNVLEYDKRGFQGTLKPIGNPKLVSGEEAREKIVDMIEENKIDTNFPSTKTYDKDGFTGQLVKNGNHYKSDEIVKSRIEAIKETSIKNNFAESKEYNLDGYIGKLVKKGNPIVTSGEHIPRETKVVKEEKVGYGKKPTDFPAEVKYLSEDFYGVLPATGDTTLFSGEFVPKHSKIVKDTKEGTKNSFPSSIRIGYPGENGTLYPKGEPRLVSGRKTKVEKIKVSKRDKSQLPKTVAHNQDGFTGTLYPKGSPFEDGVEYIIGTIGATATKSENKFDDTMYIEKDGFTGNIPKKGESKLISGSDNSGLTKTVTETITRDKLEDLPDKIMFLTNGTIEGVRNVIVKIATDGYVGNLHKVGNPVALNNTASIGDASITLTHENYSPVKQEMPLTYDYDKDGYAGKIKRVSQTFEKKPQSVNIELTGSHYSTNSNVEMDINELMADVKTMLEGKEYGYTGIVLDRWEWKGNTKGPGKFTSDKIKNGKKDDTVYDYMRESNLYVKVDGYKTSANYEGKVMKSGNGPYEQKYEGVLTLSGVDTRIWEQEYFGEVKKPVKVYSQNFEGEVVNDKEAVWKQDYEGTVNYDEVDTRIWKRYYEGEVVKDEIDTRVWEQAYEGEVRHITPLYSQKYSGKVKTPDTRVWEQTYGGAVDKVITKKTTVELLRDDKIVYKGLENDYEDFEAIDRAKPNNIDFVDLIINNGDVAVDIVRPKDNGTKYKYQVKNLDNLNNKTASNMEEITIESGIKGYSYVIDNSPNTIPDNSVDTTEDVIRTKISDTKKYYVHIKAVDFEGNVSDTIHLSYQDNVAPTLTLEPSTKEWTNKDIIIKVTADDNLSGIKEIILPNGRVVSGSTTEFVVSENGKYVFEVIDYSGNKVKKTIEINNIDKTPPTKPTINTNTEWTNAETVEVNIVAGKDTQVGVKETLCRLTGDTVKDWFNCDKSFNITNEGITTITSKTIDKLGNSSEETKVEVKIDRVKPYNTSIVINRNETYSNNRLVDLSLYANDATSGVVKMQFKNENGSWSTPEDYKTTKKWTLSNVDGDKVVSVRYQDKAGNWSEEVSSSIILDTSAPVVSKFTIQDGREYYNNHSVVLNLLAKDNLSGINKVYVSNDNSNWTEMEYSETLNWKLLSGDGNKTVYLKILDNAGNMSKTITDKIFIDTVKPTGSIVINGGNEQTMSRDVKVTFNYSDNSGGSGMSIVKIVEKDNHYEFPKLPSSPSTIDWRLEMGSGLRTVHLVLVDKAGNVSDVISDSIVVDKVAIEDFTLTDIVNPIKFNARNPFRDLEWSFSPQPMLAGGNISFAINLKTPYDASVVNDSVTYRVEVIGKNYRKILANNMEAQGYDNYSKTITLPEDAPKGSKVFIVAEAKRELLVSPFDIQTVFFPGEEAGTKAQIGVINGSIQDAIRFNEIR